MALNPPGEKPRNENPDRYVYWLVGSVCALLLGAAVLGRDGLLSVFVNERRRGELREEVWRLGRENRTLRSRIRSLRSDLTSIERIAREDLGLVKPGEKVYEFIRTRERGQVQKKKRP